MGSGASMEKDSLKPLLLSEELVNGSASLALNALLRKVVLGWTGFHNSFQMYNPDSVRILMMTTIAYSV